MKTYITTAHEEEYGENENKKTLGVLLNYSEDNKFKESLVYIYTHKTKIYTFLTTIIDMIDFLVYEDKKINRAYMEEDEFDQYFDADYIDGEFSSKLTWQ